MIPSIPKRLRAFAGIAARQARPSAHGLAALAGRGRAIVAISVAMLAAPAIATAQSSAVSSNWSGYAVTAASPPARLSRVAGSWVQPSGKCEAGRATFAVAWVGLGGFNRGSRALEQAGTALDCNRSGRAVSFAWYELVPAAPVRLRVAVHPGDAVAASVAERAGRTILQVRDLTADVAQTVVRTASPLDLSSAEWIVEAPSLCFSARRCTPLPLTDFGTIAFSKASVSTATARRAAIAARSLRATRLELRDYSHGSGRPPQRAAAAAATGIASPLSAAGDAFTVTWQALASEGSQTPQPASDLTSAAASSRR